jgi:osmotically-inducible protein OsmY
MKTIDLRRTGEDMADRVNKQVAKQTAILTKQAAALLDRASGLAERVDTMQADVARRVVPQPKPRRGMTVLLLVAGAAAGYVAAYFTDAERGRSRRAEVARQFEGLGREANRIAQRSAIVATDKASGIKSRVMPRGDEGDTDDLTILDRVESEVFRDPTIPKGDINVMVVEGKAVLRGQVPEKQIGAIEAAVRKVVGVRDVENLLHVAGTPAPNKASARAATGEGSGSSV